MVVVILVGMIVVVILVVMRMNMHCMCSIQSVYIIKNLNVSDGVLNIVSTCYRHSFDLGLLPLRFG